jgi:hypothetical protein
VEIQQLSVRIAAQKQRAFDPEALIPVFHRWIRERRLPHRLLIDVADYRHVHDGPGVLIIAHECHFGVGRSGGRLGFEYSRKRDQPGPAREKLREALRDSFAICHLLEAEETVPLSFRSGNLELRVMSRLYARPGAESAAAFRPELESVAKPLYGDGIDITSIEDPGGPFGMRLDANSHPPLDRLLDLLGAEPSP